MICSLHISKKIKIHILYFLYSIIIVVVIIIIIVVVISIIIILIYVYISMSISEFCKHIFVVEGFVLLPLRSRDGSVSWWHRRILRRKFCLPRKKVRFLKKHFELKKCEFFASVFVEILLLVIFSICVAICISHCFWVSCFHVSSAHVIMPWFLIHKLWKFQAENELESLKDCLAVLKASWSNSWHRNTRKVSFRSDVWFQMKQRVCCC